MITKDGQYVSELKIRSGQTLAELYAIITAGDACAFVWVDGSLRFVWPSGNRTNVYPNQGTKATGAEALQKALSVLKEAAAAGFGGRTPVAHMVPQNLTSPDAMKAWFKSIGVEFENHDTHGPI